MSTSRRTAAPPGTAERTTPRPSRRSSRPARAARTRSSATAARSTSPTASTSSAGHTCIVNGRLTGGDPAATAVINKDAAFFGRNLATGGYGTAIRCGRKVVRGPNVDQIAWPKTCSLFGAGGKSLNLPVEQPPVPPYGDPATWKVIQPGKDSTAAIQKAIDDGHETIFLSAAGMHYISDTIHVRNKVRRIMGAPSLYRSRGFTSDKLISYKPLKVRKAPNEKPVWRIEDGSPGVVMIEFLGDSYGSAGWGVEHASKRTLILWAAGGTYRNTVSGGRAFFIDGPPGPGTVINGPQRAWAWHTNTESYVHNPHILNNGGTLWILGIKTEKDRTIVTTKNGGFTEIMGGLLYKNRERIGPAPAFISIDSSVALTYKVTGRSYQLHVQETQNGVTRALAHEQTAGGRMPLYVGLKE